MSNRPRYNPKTGNYSVRINPAGNSPANGNNAAGPNVPPSPLAATPPPEQSSSGTPSRIAPPIKRAVAQVKPGANSAASRAATEDFVFERNPGVRAALAKTNSNWVPRSSEAANPVEKNFTTYPGIIVEGSTNPDNIEAVQQRVDLQNAINERNAALPPQAGSVSVGTDLSPSVPASNTTTEPARIQIASETRQPSLYSLSSDEISRRTMSANQSYLGQEYEQADDFVRRSRPLPDDLINSYVEEGLGNAANAYGVAPNELNDRQKATVTARTHEQVIEGAPLVVYDPAANEMPVAGNPVSQFFQGAKRGWENQNIIGAYVDGYVPGGKGNNGSYSRSIVGDAFRGEHPTYLYKDRPLAEQVGVTTGRVVGDIMGNGTRKFFWNMHPEDATSTYGKQYLNRTAMSPGVKRGLAYLATNTLGTLSGNYAPLNFAEGGRPAGFQAITADEDDARKSNAPLLDYMVYRGMFGRGGYVLPWEQFTEERPEVPYEDYAKYKEYLRTPGPTALLGLAKGTMDGIDGPEARIMGYRVTPLGALGATAIIAGGYALGSKRKRIGGT